MSRLLETIAAHGLGVSPIDLDRQQVWQLQQHWREVFLAEFRQRYGRFPRPYNVWQGVLEHPGVIRRREHALDAYSAVLEPGFSILDWVAEEGITCQGRPPARAQLEALAASASILCIFGLEFGWTLVLYDEWGHSDALFATAAPK